jgi:hypothetical protein
MNLIFLGQSHYFSFKKLLIYPHEAEWTPFQTCCYAEYLIGYGELAISRTKFEEQKESPQHIQKASCHSMGL